jgi:DNA-binding protein Fis
MSKNNEYQPNTPDYVVGQPAALRLRLMTLKDLAHAFLEELAAAGAQDPAGVECGIDFYDEVRRFEIELIQSALRHTGGVQTEAAVLLGLKPTTLHAKLKQYHIAAAEFVAHPSASSAAAAAARRSSSEGDERGPYREGERGETDAGVPVLA